MGIAPASRARSHASGFSVVSTARRKSVEAVIVVRGRPVQLRALLAHVGVLGAVRTAELAAALQPSRLREDASLVRQERGHLRLRI